MGSHEYDLEVESPTERLARVRGEQLDLAIEIVARMLATLDGKTIREQLAFLGEKFDGDESRVDRQAHAILMKVELVRNVHTMVVTYEDWLSLRLIQGGRWEVKQPIPPMTEEMRLELVKRCFPDVDQARLQVLAKQFEFVLADLNARPTRLPPVGTLIDGTVEPDIFTFSKWRNMILGVDVKTESVVSREERQAQLRLVAEHRTRRR